MQQNITVIDEEYENQFDKGSKKAKMGEAKIINIKKYARQQLLNQAPKEEEKKEMPASVQVEVPGNNIAFEPKEVEPENKVIQFPGKEVFESRLIGMGVTCYSNFPGEVIKTNAARRLRTASIVPESLIQTTNTVGVLNEIVREEVKGENKIIQFPSKETFDFSQLVSNQESVVENKEGKIIQFPSKETFGFTQAVSNQESVVENKEVVNKQMPSIDDYFKKEIQTNQDEYNVDDASSELQTARDKYENIIESYKTQCEIKDELKKELEKLRKQKIIKLEEYRQKTLEATQNLNSILSEINQLRDEVEKEKNAFESMDEDSYGMTA